MKFDYIVDLNGRFREESNTDKRLFGERKSCTKRK